MKCVFQGNQLIKYAAKRPDIALVSVRLVLADLGRHVVRSALHCHRVVLGAFKNFTDAEIAKFNIIVVRQKDILRFQVTVKDLSRMHVFETEAELYEPVHYLHLSELLLCLFLFPNMICQVAIFAKLHYNYENAFLEKCVLVRHDIRMI